MSAIISVTPAFAGVRIEEITEQIVWVKRTQVLRFQHARALKFREAFQLISR
jgi:hypothetical protein